MLLEKITDSVS